MSRAQKMRKIITRDYNTHTEQRRRQGPGESILAGLMLGGRMQESRVATKRPLELERLNEFSQIWAYINYSARN